MGAFDKTLEFIRNSSVEELTNELLKYGVEFEEKIFINHDVHMQKSIYQQDPLVSMVNSSRTTSKGLLAFYATANKTNVYSPDIKKINFGDNTFDVSLDKDVA